MTLDEVLTKRAEIAEDIKRIVDESAEQWGVDILAIEMQNIDIFGNDRKNRLSESIVNE